MQTKRFGLCAALSAAALLLLAGCAGSGSTAAPTLTVESSYPLQYAKQFTVDECTGGYELITIADSQYLVVPQGAAVPEDLPQGTTVLQQPIENIYLVSTSAMDPIISLGALDSIALSGTKADGWYLPEAKAAMQAGQIAYAGKYSAPDYETILASGCGLAIENTMIYHTPEVKEQLEKFGIPVLVERSSYETDPLARMEWVKLYGILLGKQQEAEQLFDTQVQRVAREFGIDRQQHGIALAYRQLDGKLNALRGARLGGDVFQILVGYKDVRQNCTQLHLAQNATRLHVAQHALKVAHAGGDGLHVAQALVHGLELVAHLLKRCRQAIVERAGELLVHRRTHLIELHVVVLADGAQLSIDRLAHLVQAMLDALAIGAELLGRLAAQVIHPVTSLRELACDGQVTLLLHGRIGRLLLRDGIGRAAGFGQRDVQGIERVVGLLECCQRFRATVATLPQLGTQALELEGASHSNPHHHPEQEH